MIVVDASAAVEALLHDGAARRAAEDTELRAPHLIDIEVLSVLRRLVLAGELSADSARLALGAWKSIAVIRAAVVPVLDRAWELRRTVTAYDAAYVALAESLGCSLVTTDARLARAPGPRCSITLLPQAG